MDSAAFAAARVVILGRLADAAARARRDPATIEVVAVTKTVDAARIHAAIAAGFRTLGENRVQERQAKAAELEGPARRSPPHPPGDAPSWHLIGPLQSNKARRAVELFDVIQTVDSLDLARRLSRIAGELRPGRPLPILLQANVDADVAKAGFQLDDLDRDLPAILELPDLAIDGLMTVGRLVEDAQAARPTFVALRQLSERLRARHTGLGAALSMGMSNDYPVAVEEGATLVRIGSAIFGARPTVR
jgi:pyridoxal phosphate enzyme (YggS family)